MNYYVPELDVSEDESEEDESDEEESEELDNASTSCGTAMLGLGCVFKCSRNSSLKTNII